MLCFLIWKSKYRLGSVVAILITIPIALGIMPQKWFDRMNTMRHYEEDGSAMARLNSWSFAINVAMDRPVAGGGFEVFRPEYFARYAPDTTSFDAHSIYFEILGEHGFVGLSLFLSLGASVWWTSFRLRRRSRGDPELEEFEHLARMMQVSVVGYAVGGAFLGLAYFDLYYNLVAIVVIVKGVIAEYSPGENAHPIAALPPRHGVRPVVLRVPRMERL
jgi:probable O-glycosylation ligase (exosortase A-associated)